MNAYVTQLKKLGEAEIAERSKMVCEAEHKAARDRLTPLETRLEKLLSTIPIEVQREGLSLNTLQASLRGRWRGTCHPGELGHCVA